MEEREITNWKDLTLLQLGSVLRNFVTDKNGRMSQEWLILVNDINRAERSLWKNARSRRWKGFAVNTSLTLFAYFFTFTAVVHKRFLHPGKSLKLEEIVQGYHLDLLARSLSKESADFYFYYSGMIPHRYVLLAEARKTKQEEVDFVDEKGGQWIRRTDEECIGICWTRMLNYLEKVDAPAPGTKAGDAFAWLEKQNQSARVPIYSPEGNLMFHYRDECEMGEMYSRFIQQMDAWNPHGMKVWAEYRSRARRQLRELSAALDLEPVGPEPDIVG